MVGENALPDLALQFSWRSCDLAPGRGSRTAVPRNSSRISVNRRRLPPNGPDETTCTVDGRRLLCPREHPRRRLRLLAPHQSLVRNAQKMSKIGTNLTG
jgi:hypothetical protein